MTENAIEMQWVEVPAGAFFFGEQRERRVIGQAYRIGKHPVTNAQYRRFALATGHAPPLHWDASGDFAAGLSAHPVVFVSWRDAQAYCAWLSAQVGAHCALPSEEQWERAARGADGRLYPWGDTFDPARANVREAGVGNTSAVGAFPGGASQAGALDMAGNVWEWTAGEEGDARVALRGGSWMHYALFARCDARYLETRAAVLNDAGFRVVSR